MEMEIEIGMEIKMEIEIEMKMGMEIKMKMKMGVEMDVDVTEDVWLRLMWGQVVSERAGVRTCAESPAPTASNSCFSNVAK